MRVPSGRAVPLALPAVLLLTASCGVLPGTGPAEPRPSQPPSPSAPSSPTLPTLHELVRAHIADTWAHEAEYTGRCEALGLSEQADIARRNGVCLALFADWRDSTVFVLGPPASEPVEALRLTTPDGTHWELAESHVIEDPYAPGPQWLEEAARTKDDPAEWEITAPTMAEVAETWLADRYLPLDCEHGDGDHEGRDAWCPQAESPEHEETPPPDGRGSVLVTYNAEPRYRLVMEYSGDAWSLTETVATEDFAPTHFLDGSTLLGRMASDGELHTFDLDSETVIQVTASADGAPERPA
ncbi:hypothetical protein NI17_022920 [Thermobifida halotolerans]|uniref:Lipoprotein n=1 Tax=Thermobifida halotolerans TaxID=483545 RepID=A0AA97LX58_9ACTN|nr:hypothetical protein [Thermobifida halotolerans]UOE19531.1 hypothetical protein NI17_022920 [Thermobifida halotolerans]